MNKNGLFDGIQSDMKYKKDEAEYMRKYRIYEKQHQAWFKRKQQFEQYYPNEDFPEPEPSIEPFQFRETQRLDRFDSSKTLLSTLVRQTKQPVLDTATIPDKPCIEDEEFLESTKIETLATNLEKNAS